MPVSIDRLNHFVYNQLRISDLTDAAELIKHNLSLHGRSAAVKEELVNFSHFSVGFIHMSSVKTYFLGHNNFRLFASQ